jgi:hypothetical protein
MHRLIISASLVTLCLATTSADLLAQTDPRVRRANREKAVAIVGLQGRDFVETYGEPAVEAIFACSKYVAVRLADLHASGKLAKLSRPADLLRVIAYPKHGDEVALWAINHADELADKDSFNAYLASPLEYALGLKQLQAGAAAARANRLDPPAPATPSAASKVVSTLDSLTSDDRIGVTACICFAILLLVGLWRRKRYSMDS